MLGEPLRGQGAVGFGVRVVAAEALDGKILRQLVRLPEVGEGGEQVAKLEIPGGAEDEHVPDHEVCAPFSVARARLKPLEITPMWLKACG